MPFSEQLKLTVKKKANFTCCWCKERRNKAEVHHIIPESQEGPDTEENAAPLCGSCHDLYGNNPDLQKEIRSRRNHWYESCAGSPVHKESANADLPEVKIEFSSKYIESNSKGELYDLEISITNGDQVIDRFKLEFTFPALDLTYSPFSPHGPLKPVGAITFNTQNNAATVVTKEERLYRIIYQSRTALFQNDRCFVGREIGLRYCCIPNFRGSEEWRVYWKFYTDSGLYQEGHVSIFDLWWSSQRGTSSRREA